MTHEITDAFYSKSGFENFGGAVTDNRRNLVVEICHTGILSLNR
jgi:hypothetical protein